MSKTSVNFSAIKLKRKNKTEKKRKKQIMFLIALLNKTA